MRKTNIFQKNFKKLFQNVIVLYILVAIAVINIIGYLVNNKLSSLVLFLVIGLGISYLTKNMIWILFTTIILTNIITATGILKRNSMYEGYTNNGKKHKKKKIEKFGSKIMDESEDEVIPYSSSKNNKGKSKVSPTAVPDDSDSDDDQAFISKPKINHKKTMENSYNQLNKMMGSKGLKNMTNDTSNLLDKQENLIGQLKSMEPMMNKANDMLQTLQGGGLLGSILGNKKKKNDE